MFTIHLDSALHYSQQAEELAKEKNFKKGLLYALNESTDILIEKDELAKSELKAQACNKLALQLKDSLTTAISWLQMAQEKMYNNDFDGAIPLFIQSLQYYLANHPTKYSALAFNDLGYTLGRKGELGKQANCLVQSNSIYETYFPQMYEELGVAYNNLSTVYNSLKDKQKAIEYAKKSMYYREKSGDISRLAISCCNLSQYYIGVDSEEADKYMTLCLKYAMQSGQESRIIHSYITASTVYDMNGKFEEALNYELKAIASLEKKQPDVSMLSRRYIAAAILSKKLKKDSSVVLGYLKKSQELLSCMNDKNNLRGLHLQLSNYYRDNKNYAAAYEHYKKYIAYRDSIVTEKTEASIAEITTQYETEKKTKRSFG